MQKTNYYSAKASSLKGLLLCLILAFGTIPTLANSAQQTDPAELLSGHYSRDGNNGSPSKTAGNNIYIKFFADRWLGMMFIPYPYAIEVEAPIVTQVFDTAKKQTSSSSYLRGKFGHLSENATVHIERYGYMQDRIVFECGSLAPCTIKIGNGFLELIKPGVINEHIIKYNHVATP